MLKRNSPFIATILLSIAIIPAKAQSLGDLFNKVTNNSGSRQNTSHSNSTGSIGNLSNTDIVSGLKQALQIGAKNAGDRLSAQNGYFGNALIKVLMPPEAKKVETALRQVGMGQLVDETILKMNQAAEDAASKAVPIFIDAITHMSIEDGVNILRGGNGAATNFLKNRTTVALTNAFRPVIQKSLDKVGAANLWSQVFGFYNKMPMTFTKINPDLTGYVTERALNGLFVTIAEEENKIRTNPADQVTDLLKKVFGSR